MSRTISTSPKALIPFGVLLSPLIICIPIIGLYRGLWDEAAKIAVVFLLLFAGIIWLVVSQRIIVTEKSVVLRGAFKAEKESIPLRSIEFGVIVFGSFARSRPKKIELYGALDVSGEHPHVATIDLRWYPRRDVDWLIAHPGLKVARKHA